jgi:hypothetical protein
MATLSALEQITGKSLTRDPEMKKLFPNTRVMSVFDALTGPRQTRLDARDLPPSTPQPAYVYRDNPVTQFLHKHLLGDNFYPYKKPVRRADGSPEEGEVAPRLTMQQIEALTAREAAERESMYAHCGSTKVNSCNCDDSKRFAREQWVRHLQK